jgi:hypothetical protein
MNLSIDIYCLLLSSSQNQNDDPGCASDSLLLRRAEPEFVNLLGRPGIDSQPSGLVRQTYLTHRPDKLHRLAESTPRNRFLGSLNVYKFGLSSSNKSCCQGPALFFDMCLHKPVFSKKLPVQKHQQRAGQ